MTVSPTASEASQGGRSKTDWHAWAQVGGEGLQGRTVSAVGIYRLSSSAGLRNF